MSREATPTDLHWAGLHVDALAVHDAAGRMLRWNSVPGEPSLAPIFFFAATAHGNLWRVRAGLPDPLTRELCRLAGAERTQAPPGADPERLATLEQRIRAEAFGSAPPPPMNTFRGFAYCFPDTLIVDSDVVLLGEDELGDVEEAFPHLAGTVGRRAPCLVSREGGHIVSVCCAALLRGSDGGVEASVDTVASHRGRGHAPRVVSAWAAEVRRREGTPLYSASRDNKASLAVARRLGLRQYAATLHIREAA